LGQGDEKGRDVGFNKRRQSQGGDYDYHGEFYSFGKLRRQTDSLEKDFFYYRSAYLKTDCCRKKHTGDLDDAVRDGAQKEKRQHALRVQQAGEYAQHKSVGEKESEREQSCEDAHKNHQQHRLDIILQYHQKSAPESGGLHGSEKCFCLLKISLYFLRVILRDVKAGGAGQQKDRQRNPNIFSDAVNIGFGFLNSFVHN